MKTGREFLHTSFLARYAVLISTKWGSQVRRLPARGTGFGKDESPDNPTFPERARALLRQQRRLDWHTCGGEEDGGQSRHERSTQISCCKAMHLGFLLDSVDVARDVREFILRAGGTASGERATEDSPLRSSLLKRCLLKRRGKKQIEKPLLYCPFATPRTFLRQLVASTRYNRFGGSVQQSMREIRAGNPRTKFAVIGSVGDKVLPVAHHDELARGLRADYFLKLDGSAGHCPNYTHPDVVNAFLEEFMLLAEQDAGGPGGENEAQPSDPGSGRAASGTVSRLELHKAFAAEPSIRAFLSQELFARRAGSLEGGTSVCGAGEKQQHGFLRIRRMNAHDGVMHEMPCRIAISTRGAHGSNVGDEAFGGVKYAARL